MHLVIYVSSAIHLFSQPELDELLAKAREKNSRLGITGMLLYKDGCFMQVLEGPREAVAGLLARIEMDPRHNGMLKLLQKENEKREFAEWSMGFKRLDEKTIADVHGFSDFLQKPLVHDVFRENPSQALHLLLTFRKLAG